MQNNLLFTAVFSILCSIVSVMIMRRLDAYGLRRSRKKRERRINALTIQIHTVQQMRESLRDLVITCFIFLFWITSFAGLGGFVLGIILPFNRATMVTASFGGAILVASFWAMVLLQATRSPEGLKQLEEQRAKLQQSTPAAPPKTE